MMPVGVIGLRVDSDSLVTSNSTHTVGRLCTGPGTGTEPDSVTVTVTESAEVLPGDSDSMIMPANGPPQLSVGPHCWLSLFSLLV
jgi:hypothetical protein